MEALLTVDWDAFNRRLLEADHDLLTEEEKQQLLLYDWGHREALFFILTIWVTRAAGFLRNGLPLPGTTGEQEGFWGRCRIAPGAKLYLSESHLTAAHERIMEGVTEVVNFDAHHDAGYRRLESTKGDPRWAGPVPPRLPDEFNCGNWATKYLLKGASYTVVYPRWRGGSAYAAEPEPEWRKVNRRVDDGGEVFAPSGRPFTKVHVCRSGAWVPPWNDPALVAFLKALGPRNEWRILGPRTGLHLPRRPWSDAEAREHADFLTKAIEEMHARREAGLPPDPDVPQVTMSAPVTGATGGS